MEGIPILESKTHYLYCAAHSDIRAETTRRVLERINQGAYSHQVSIPNFWNADEKLGHVPNRRWTKIEESFGPEDAAKGFI